MPLPFETERMGDALRTEVERQLLMDLSRCVDDPSHDTFIDWSGACQEGHCTEHLGGILEDLSGVAARRRDGAVIAEGWIDFIHGGPSFPLVVFWVVLRIRTGGSWEEIRTRFEIPEVVWSSLSEESRQACTTVGGYDSRWSKDPKVVAWARRRQLPA